MKTEGKLLVLKFFAVLLSLLLVYMAVAQEIRILPSRGGASELISLADHPLRFFGIFFMVAIVDWLLIRELRRTRLR